MIGLGVRHTHRLSEAVLPALYWTPVATVAGLAAYAVMTIVAVRMLSIGLREGYHPVRSRSGWQLWATERLMDGARNYLFPLYASLATPAWLRMLGAKVGRDTEISTVLLTPKFTVIEDGAFLADDTMVASYELGGGWIYAATTTVGRRAFLGNSGITQPGRRVPDDGLVAVLSAAPPKAKRGSSWLGSPPMRLRRRPAEADAARTYEPPWRLKAMRATRGGVPGDPGDGDRRDRARGAGCAAGAGSDLRHLVGRAVRWAGAAGCGRVGRGRRGRREMASGRPDSGRRISAVVVVRVAQRTRGHVCGDRRRAVVRPRGQWDTGDERVAAGAGRQGRPRRVVRNAIGCQRPTLSRSAAGSTVNRGCVVQTHLFHDRIMRMDEVVLEQGATLGPHGVALPSARLGAGVTVGPASLVVRGDSVPKSTRWQGNPIRPWNAPREKSGKKAAA